MAEDSGVTEAGLKAKITEQLQASHVQIEDMSGMFVPCVLSVVFGFYPTMPLHCPVQFLTLAIHARRLRETDDVDRRLWPSILCDHRVAAV